MCPPCRWTQPLRTPRRRGSYLASVARTCSFSVARRDSGRRRGRGGFGHQVIGDAHGRTSNPQLGANHRGKVRPHLHDSNGSAVKVQDFLLGKSMCFRDLASSHSTAPPSMSLGNLTSMALALISFFSGSRASPRPQWHEELQNPNYTHGLQTMDWLHICTYKLFLFPG